jgi:putative transposase
MAVLKAPDLQASPESRQILDRIVRRQKAPVWLVTRCRIIICALDGLSIRGIARQLGIERNTVRKWRDRWRAASEGREVLESQAKQEADKERELEAYLIDSLRDAYRSGTPPKFSAEQVVQIVAIACESPEASGYPISQWSAKEVRLEAIRRGIVEDISERQVGRFLK